MRIVYFAPDLADAALVRRVQMLLAGGAQIKLLGFRRTPRPIDAVAGVPAIDLGQTFDGKLINRLALVLRRSLGAGRLIGDSVARADAVLARNLEMATIADAARKSIGSQVPLVYECLDIHGSLLGRGMASQMLRRWEKRLLRKSTALVVSSPGFVSNYFNTLGIDLPPVILAENKRVLLNGPIVRPQGFDPAPPWKIGWFGIIRCVESFLILHGLARRHPRLVDIEIRGRPTAELQHLIDKHLPLVNMRFGGVYVQADLASLYQNCHLTWAIDYFQRGRNSDWLLPNRIYEGGFYNRPAIALAGTETAKWLHARGAGVILQNPSELDHFLIGLESSQYRELYQSTATIPVSDLVDTSIDCERFALRIAGS
jgi:hypothetical protein